MASRKEFKEQRRHDREEAERQAAQSERRRRRLRIYGGSLAALAVGAAAALIMLAGGGEDDPKEAFAAKPDGLQQRVDDARLTPGAAHFHPLVRVVANGQDVPIPDDIGVAPGVGHVPIHRHAGDDKVHAEGLEEGRFTLGQFMRVWGVPFGATQLGPYRAGGRRKVTVLVKPKGETAFRESRAFDKLQLRDGQEVYVVYGTPEQSPIVL